MPHTLPPVDMQAIVQPQVQPAGHGQPAYTDDPALPTHAGHSHASSLSPSPLPSPGAEDGRGRSAVPKDLEGKKEEERSESKVRRDGMSKVRKAIRELVNDPFFHRPSKEEAAAQDAEMKRIILQEIDAARRSTEAGDLDRAVSRSRSHARSPLGGSPAGSRNGSRAGSRVREFFTGHHGHKKEEATTYEATVKE
ncbi:hypothetical protein JCM11251_003484 [Rhodosporidiobolus azoricus]